jgi:nicotinamide-nucleotide amidase
LTEKTAIIFCIGHELLEGTVLDRNATFMSKNLSELGHRVRSIIVLDDVEKDAIGAFRHALNAAPDYILITGGMGPGLDDITRHCVAEAVGVSLVPNKKAEEMLANSYRRLLAKGVIEDAELDERRLIMAQVPEGAECYENPIGTAPALKLVAESTTFYLLPGMPEEMRRFFSEIIMPVLEAEGPGYQRKSRVLEYPGADETIISRMLSDLGRRHPGIKARARLQGAGEKLNMRITLSASSMDVEELKSALDKAEADLRARLGLEMVGDPAGGEVPGE